MKPEDEVFLCSWSRKGKAWQVWVRDRPRTRATGKSFDEANERLLEQL
jgi:hypothetical protein